MEDSSKIQNMLDTASAFCALAQYETDREAGVRIERCALYTQIATAHALTALALIALKNTELAQKRADIWKPVTDPRPAQPAGSAGTW